MIYLSYRLEKAEISTLIKIAVVDIGETWVWEQIKDEFKMLYPNVHIDLVGEKLPLTGSLDLLVVPYRQKRGLCEVWNDWREAKKLSANWIMLYELEKRQINLVRTQNLGQLLLERIDYHWLEQQKKLLFNSKILPITLKNLLKIKKS